MTLLLDTHILVWFRVEPKRLKAAQKRAVQASLARGEALAISAITLWELAWSASRGRIQTTQPLATWLRTIERDPRLEVLPISADVAVQGAQFSGRYPSDPADRIIAATATCAGLTLVTSDDAIRRSGEVLVV